IRLVHLIFLLVIAIQLLDGRPRSSPCRWVINGDLDRKCIGIEPLIPFDEMQVFARPAVFVSAVEVDDIDDEGIPFPMATRVSVALPDTTRQMRRIGNGNDSGEAFSLTNVVIDGHGVT